MLLRLIKDFFLGIRAYFKAFIFVYEYNLWLYFIVPVLVSIGLYYGGDMILEELKYHDFNKGLHGLNFDEKLKNFKFDEIVPNDNEVQLIIGALKLLFVISAFAFNKYLVLIMLAPLNTTLSAKTERILTGNKYPFDYGQLISDIYRTINFSLRNGIRQGILIGIWLIIEFLIPIIEPASPYVIFWIAAYYYGATLIDYNSERRKLSWEDSVKFIKRYSGMSLSLGGVFSLLYFNSYVGIIVGPIMGVVAATIAVHDRIGLKKRNSLKQEVKKISDEEKLRDQLRKGEENREKEEKPLEAVKGKNIRINPDKYDDTDWEY